MVATLVVCPACRRPFADVSAADGATVFVRPVSGCRSCGARFEAELSDGEPVYTVTAPAHRTPRVRGAM